MGNIEKTDFAAVLMAVLLSVIVSPFALRRSLVWASKRKQQKLTEVRTGPTTKEGYQAAYFCISVKAHGRWGHQDKLLRVLFNLNLGIIDFRAWHSADSAQTHHRPYVTNIFYVEVKYSIVYKNCTIITQKMIQ